MNDTDYDPLESAALESAVEAIRKATQEYNDKYPERVPQVYVSPTGKRTVLLGNHVPVLRVYSVHLSTEFDHLKPWYKLEFGLIRRLSKKRVGIDLNYIFRDGDEISQYEMEIAKTSRALLPEVG